MANESKRAGLLRLVIAAAIAMCGLAACGGGGDSDEPAARSAPVVVPAPTCRPRVVSVALLGDSTMFGLDGLSPGDATRAAHQPGVELQAQMDLQFGAGAVVVTNYGVSGSVAPQAPHVVADVVVANFGINDMKEPNQTIENYSMTMKALGATLIETQNPIVVRTWHEEDYVAAAKRLGLPVADVNAFVLTLPDWQAQLGPIGVHPSDWLYQQIVDNVLAPAVALQVAPLRCL